MFQCLSFSKIIQTFYNKSDFNLAIIFDFTKWDINKESVTVYFCDLSFDMFITNKIQNEITVNEHVNSVVDVIKKVFKNSRLRNNFTVKLEEMEILQSPMQSSTVLRESHIVKDKKKYMSYALSAIFLVLRSIKKNNAFLSLTDITTFMINKRDNISDILATFHTFLVQLCIYGELQYQKN